MGDLLAGSKTLDIVKKVGNNTYACYCRLCKTTPDTDVVNMNYNPSLGQTECRMCKLYSQSEGYDWYQERNNSVKSWISNSINLSESFNNCDMSKYNSCLLRYDYFILNKDFFEGDGIYSTHPLCKKVYFRNNIGLDVDGDFRVVGLRVTAKGGTPNTKYGYGFSGFNLNNLSYVVYCNHCANYIITEKINEDYSKNGFKCPFCYKARMQFKKSVSNKISQSNIKNIKSNKETPFETVKVISEKIRPLIESEVKELMSSYQGDDITFGGVSREKNHKTINLHFICKKCGNIFSHKRSTKLDSGVLNIDLTCPNCDKVKDSHIKGKFAISHVGEVYNYLVVTEQDNESMTCTLECTNCKKKFNNLPLYDVIESRLYYCTCEPLIDSKTNRVKQRGSTITDFCPCANTDECVNSDCKYAYEEMSKSVKDVLNNNVVCPYNKNLNLSDGLLQTMIKEDLSTTFVKKGQLINKSFKGRIDLKKSTKLRVEGAPIYIGTDSKPYHRCMCMECSSMLTLNTDEISSFNHGELCFDSRQGFIRDIEFKKLKF